MDDDPLLQELLELDQVLAHRSPAWKACFMHDVIITAPCCALQDENEGMESVLPQSSGSAPRWQPHGRFPVYTDPKN
jgi:hypothetical protein